MANHTLCICKVRCFLCGRMVMIRLSKTPQGYYNNKIYDMLCGKCIGEHVVRVSHLLEPGKPTDWGYQNDPQAN